MNPVSIFSRTLAISLFAIAAAGTVLGFSLGSALGLCLLGAAALENARLAERCAA